MSAQHLSDSGIHTAVGNGVYFEQGQALVHAISKFWDADWFYDRINKKIDKQDVFCLRNGEEVSVTNDQRCKREIEAENECEENGATQANYTTDGT